MDIISLRSRVESILSLTSQSHTIELQNTLYLGTISIMQAMYGFDSSQERDLRAYIERLREKTHPANEFIIKQSISAIKGALISIKSELDSGFVGSLRATLSGEVLTDIIKLARAVLEEQGEEAKNVASVLAAAAFEDIIRKLADIKKCGDAEKLADLLIRIKDAGVLQGAEVSIAQSYLSFRNRALHAKWNEVDRPSVESVIAFIEQIILKHFT
jgi:hypothetical protein